MPAETLGPRDSVSSLAVPGSPGFNNSRFLSIGASKRVVGNIELMFPVPFMKDDRSLRLSLFLDGGTVFNQFSELNNFIRYSAGVAVTWVSPMGPLKVSIAQPLNDQPSDNLQRKMLAPFFGSSLYVWSTVLI